MYWHDWSDPDIRHLDEFYIAVSLLLVLTMLIGAALIW